MHKKNREPNLSSANSRHSTRSNLNIDDFKPIVQKIKNGSKEIKKAEIQNLFQMDGMITHYRHKTTKRIVVADCINFEFVHEKTTAEKLTGVNYDIIFVPKGYFKRAEKTFDIFLCREHIFLEADLKSIVSANPDTISKRIKNGSEQSSRLVLDIRSNIKRQILIQALKSGCERNNTLLEVLLFYKSRFLCLPKNLILSSKVLDQIK